MSEASRCACGRKAENGNAHGLCRTCRTVRAGRVCDVDSCDYPVRGNDLCAAHEYRKRTGRPVEAPVRRWRARR